MAGINIKQMRENAAINNSDLSMALDEIERLEKHCDELCKYLLEENSNLKRIIAKELTENDELGSEFVYVMEMKNQLREAKQEIDRIKKLNAIPLTQDVIFQNKLSAAQQELDREKEFGQAATYYARDFEEKFLASAAREKVLVEALEKIAEGKFSSTQAMYLARAALVRK